MRAAAATPWHALNLNIGPMNISLRRIVPVASTSLLLLAGCASEQSETPPAEQVAASEEVDASPAEQPAPERRTPPAEQSAPADDVPGPALGEQVPPVELPDQHGEPRSLARLLEENNVALVFYRSADW